MPTTTSLTTTYAGEYAKGRVASVKVYDRALSATEILQNYNEQKSMLSHLAGQFREIDFI